MESNIYIPTTQLVDNSYISNLQSEIRNQKILNYSSKTINLITIVSLGIGFLKFAAERKWWSGRNINHLQWLSNP